MGFVVNGKCIDFQQAANNCSVENIGLEFVDDIILHGCVVDSEPSQQKRTVVFVSVCNGKGEEIPLGHVYTGEDGYYLFAVERSSLPEDARRIMVRVGPLLKRA